MFTQHFALIVFQNFMWIEALTWVKCSNLAGNHKCTWSLRPHKVTSMREESPEIWVSMQTSGSGLENRNLLLIQTFSFSLLKAPVCILNTCLNAGSWSPSPQHLLDFAPFGHSLSLVVAPPQPNHMASAGPPSGASTSGDCSAELTVTRWHDFRSLHRNITEPLVMEDLNPWPHTHFLLHVQWPRHNRVFPGGTS